MTQSKPTWTTRDGRKLFIHEMSTEHLGNAFRLLLRQGYIGWKKFRVYLTGSADMPDGALDAFLQEQDFVFSKKPCHQLDWLEDELTKRGVDVSKLKEVNA